VTMTLLPTELPNDFDEFANASSRDSLWSQFASARNCETVCEVGVWKGAFAERMLAECPRIRTYYMLDPWRTLAEWNKPYNVDPSAFEEVMQEALSRTDFAKDRRVICRGTTTEAASQISDKSLDLCYIDGDHTLRGIVIDLVRMYDKVKDGGVLCGDDFVPNGFQHHERFEPSLVFPTVVHFAEAVGAVLYALPFGQFALLVDRAHDSFKFCDMTHTFGDHSMRSVLSRSEPPSLIDRVRRKLFRKQR
jgi:hypothetical protein